MKHEWNGREYTLYQLTQWLNRYKRRVEQLERKVTVFEAGGEAKRVALDKAMSKLYKWQEMNEQLAELIEQIKSGGYGSVPPIVESVEEIYAISGIDKNRLTKEQQTANAEYIYTYLKNAGWSKEAICALLGNIQQESWFNPGVWEVQDDPFWGYGIVQWTPYPRTRETPNPFLNWAGLNVITANEMAKNDAKQLLDLQLEFLIWSSQPAQSIWLSRMGISTYNSPYQMTFNEFIVSTNDVGELAKVFNGHYERSADAKDGTHANRVEHANEWYRYFLNW